MSIETICPNCSAEYDLRHGECPACTIQLNVRSARAPFDTWPATGHLPFEVHGERFAVTRIPCAISDPQQWRVTHIETGAGVPNSDGATKEEVREKTMTALAALDADKLKAALAKVKARFANVTGEPRPCLAPKAAPQPTCQARSLALATGSAGKNTPSWPTVWGSRDEDSIRKSRCGDR